MNGLIDTFRSRPCIFWSSIPKARCYIFSKDRSSHTLERSQYCVVYLSLLKYIFCEKYVTHVFCIKCNVNDNDNALHIVHTFIGKYVLVRLQPHEIDSRLCDGRYSIFSGKFLPLVDTTTLQEVGEKRSFIVYFRVILYYPNNYVSVKDVWRFWLKLL